MESESGKSRFRVFFSKIRKSSFLFSKNYWSLTAPICTACGAEKWIFRFFYAFSKLFFFPVRGGGHSPRCSPLGNAAELWFNGRRTWPVRKELNWNLPSNFVTKQIFYLAPFYCRPYTCHRHPEDVTLFLSMA